MYIVQTKMLFWADHKECESLDEVKQEIHNILSEQIYFPNRIRIIKVIELDIHSEYSVNASDEE